MLVRVILIAAIFALAALGAPGVALGHGNDKPQHGGIVKTMGETAIELVAGADGVDVYVREEVDEVPSAGCSGKLVVVKDGARTETPLVPAGANRLTAKGARVPPGARVSVQITLADGQTKVGANYAIP